MSEQTKTYLAAVRLKADKDKLPLDGTASIHLSGTLSDGSEADLSQATIDYSLTGPADLEEVLEGGKHVIVRAGTMTDGEAILTARVSFPDGIPVEARLPLSVVLKPARPFRHPYHQTLTMKFMVCEKNGGLRLTCEQVLESIRKLDHITRGIPKIVYLVGWQYDGHDTGYPAWDKVNERLKRPEDASALDSLKWLMDEALSYNTTVSLHINMLDINPDSPLWDEYVEKDLIARNEDGSLKQYKWGYPISYTREWEAGYTTKRIDWLLENLPLERAGTIHIDAFHHYIPGFGEEPISPYHGISTDQEIAVQKRIFRYFMDHGVDLTAEFDNRYRKDAFIGLQPFAWHFGRLDPMAIPASLYIGGEGGDARFGVSMLGEGMIKRSPDKLKGFLSEFCTTTLPWYYLNRLERLKLEQETLFFSEGVTSREEDGKIIIRQGERILRDGNDLLIPALWNEARYPELIAYSQDGYDSRSWRLPEDWQNVSAVDLYAIELEGPVLHTAAHPVKDGELVLSLQKGQALSIVPAGTNLK